MFLFLLLMLLSSFQARAIPELLSGKSALVAAETGNGKTLSFLAPMLHQALALKVEEAKEGSLRLANSPFCLVVTPGRELAKQIFNVAQDLSESLGLRTALELGGHARAKVLAGERRDVDLVVGTFGSVSRLMEEGFYRADALRHVALDEADTLLDDTFNAETVSFLARLGLDRRRKKVKGQGGRRLLDGSPHLLQLTLACATYPTSLSPILSGVFDVDDLEVVSTHRLHVVPSHIKQMFVRCRKVGREDYLMHFLAPDLARGRQCVVFSNKSSTSNYISHYLRSQGISCDSFNSARGIEYRDDALRRFIQGEVGKKKQWTARAVSTMSLLCM